MKTNFADKHVLEITAARCVGLIRSIYVDPLFDGKNAQALLESEYVTLYAQLQEICFFNNGELRWALPLAMEKLDGVLVYKTELGLGISLHEKMHIEIASKLEALAPGKGNVYDFPSVIREKARLAY